jgi:hypothetical protein
MKTMFELKTFSLIPCVKLIRNDKFKNLINILTHIMY